MWKGAILFCLKLLSLHSTRGTEENYWNFQCSRCPAEIRTRHIPNRTRALCRLSHLALSPTFMRHCLLMLVKFIRVSVWRIVSLSAYLHTVQPVTLVTCEGYFPVQCVALKVATARSSVSPVNMYQTTRHYVPEDSILFPASFVVVITNVSYWKQEIRMAYARSVVQSRGMSNSYITKICKFVSGCSYARSVVQSRGMSNSYITKICKFVSGCSPPTSAEVRKAWLSA
jgi:hypothetical protein